MRLRLSDQNDWVHEFSAATPAELRIGCRAGWCAYAQVYGWAGDPAKALRVRLGAIHAWLSERLSRAGITAELSRRWSGEAAYLRFRARREMGGDLSCSPLYLHVQGPSGRWYQLDPAKPCRVAYGLTPREASELLGLAERACATDASAVAPAADATQADTPKLVSR
jgi:hypothetical protein